MIILITVIFSFLSEPRLNRFERFTGFVY